MNLYATDASRADTFRAHARIRLCAISADSLDIREASARRLNLVSICLLDNERLGIAGEMTCKVDVGRCDWGCGRREDMSAGFLRGAVFLCEHRAESRNPTTGHLFYCQESKPALSFLGHLRRTYLAFFANVKRSISARTFAPILDAQSNYIALLQHQFICPLSVFAMSVGIL